MTDVPGHILSGLDGGPYKSLSYVILECSETGAGQSGQISDLQQAICRYPALILHNTPPCASRSGPYQGRSHKFLITVYHNLNNIWWIFQCKLQRILVIIQLEVMGDKSVEFVFAVPYPFLNEIKGVKFAAFPFFHSM